MKFSVTLDRDDYEVWSMEFPGILDSGSQGQTKAETLEKIKDAIATLPALV